MTPAPNTRHGRLSFALNWTDEPVPPCAVPLAGCRVGHVRHRYSDNRRTGRVIRQAPPSAAVRGNNARVSLIVSRGQL
jgi:hypothetical protein